MDSGSWKSLPALKGTISSLVFINLDDGPDNSTGFAYGEGIRTEPCLIASGDFMDLQAKVVRLCRQPDSAISVNDSGNCTFNCKNNNASTEPAHAAISTGMFAESWEAVLTSGSVVGDEKEAVVLAKFS